MPGENRGMIKPRPKPASTRSSIVFSTIVVPVQAAAEKTTTRPYRQRRGLAASQSASQMRPGSSGDSNFHAQNGWSSFRSPAFSSSKRLKLVPEPRIFTLDWELVPEPLPILHFSATHTYQNLGWIPPCNWLSIYFINFDCYFALNQNVVVQ